MGKLFAYIRDWLQKITRTYNEPEGYNITLKRFKYSERMSLYVYLVLQIESFVFE